MSTNRAKIVLVTGASSGIGRACAELLSAQGHTVYGTSRKPAQAPAGFRMLELDVTRDDSVQAAVATVLAEQGRLDAVVNNAGYALAGPLEETSIEEARHQFDTNFFGVLRVCQAVLPSMRTHRSGLIINVSSLGGVAGLPFQGLYSASKFALEGLTESLRLEVASFGIQVTSLQPGDVYTPITENRVRVRQSGPDSPYRSAFATALGIIEKEERAGAPAGLVARHVLTLLERKQVGVRYTVGRLSQRIITAAKAFLPSRLFEHLLKSYYGL
ncbi:SDR family oxidoreductase [Stigmatella aurantiaca]|uniref:Oxidoreductase, short chain dehydrogenase/reductase family n=1 Tax=Stigmatella aurantiaca (strain DW4/3-1) TaxID=378806 RepID=Q09ED2_STIAD|nr:SDR family oxidoreductase [Stigmatella aurantiaca]ADO74658.1 Oxidoreductase, short chain dehydrogenase/reductase family [Stigmatella aurantiaca DW4/3-1]EAU70082.1 probable dehydrogenase/ reductase 7 [Stigmatella aurantiaca DW4/3-1]